MRRSLILLLLLTGMLRAAEWRVGLVGDLTPELEASILETAREAIEVGGGSFLGEIELSRGSLGYGLPACHDADFILRVALTRNPVLDFYLIGLEASSIGSGELFGIADAGFYPPGEFLQTGLFTACLKLMMKLPPFGRAGVSPLGVEVRLDRPLEAPRPALVYRRLSPDEEPTFPYFGAALPLALVLLPPKVVLADVPILRGELEGDGLYIVVVGEATAEEIAQQLGEN